MSKKQMGFTLIEIVMVLVLLGILSAVAVPKYFDLRAQAEQKTAMAVASEFQARLNASFAQNLLEGGTCSSARTAAITEANTFDSTDAFTISDITASTGGNVELQITSKNDATKIYKKTATKTELKIQGIEVPACSDDTPTAH